MIKNNIQKTFGVCASPVARAFFAGGFLLILLASALAETCTPLDAVNKAIDAAQYEAAETQIAAMNANRNCAGFVMPVQRRLAAARLSAAQKLVEQKAPKKSYFDLIADAERPGVLWQASATLAELRFGERKFAEAAAGFDRAIEIVNNETLTPRDPGREAIENLLQRAAAARLLAANSDNGKSGYVATATRDGKLGGIFSQHVRGVVPRIVPMPITFEYRSASLTEEGQQAAQELVRAIKEQQPQSVSLVGHTDLRGAPEFNKKLSLARAEAVAAFLRDHQVALPVQPEGVGADEPLQLGNTNGLTEEDIYALNRRVEWRRE